MFAAGCILAELFSGDPLLPGSSETDMLHRLSKLIGCIPYNWTKGFDMAAGIGLTNLPGALVEPSHDQVIANLQKVLPSADHTALDLISRMIAWNPRDRPTCNECLRHGFFGNKGSPAVNNLKQHRGSLKQPNSQRGSSGYEFLRFKDSTLRRIGKNSIEDQGDSIALKVQGHFMQTSADPSN